MKIYPILVFTLLIASPFSAESKTHRSSSVKAELQRLYPCPATSQPNGACPGYVKDHIIALDCGGLDSSENMQWQTKDDAKAKDKWERKTCRK